MKKVNLISVNFVDKIKILYFRNKESKYFQYFLFFIYNFYYMWKIKIKAT